MNPLAGNYRPANLSHKMFSKNGKDYAPADLLTQNLDLTFDVATQTTTGRSSIAFNLPADSYPYLDLNATVSNAMMDGVSVPFTTVTDPDGLGNSYLTIDSVITQGSHTLELEYSLPGKVTYSNGGADFLTSMTDVSNAHFFETWGPTGFEDDSFALTLSMSLVNGTSTEQLFTNGNITSTSSNHWEIEFPPYFTKSSFYVHLTNKTFEVRNFYYHSIPVTVYSTSADLSDKAQAILPGLFEELENDYGPYPHSSFTAFVKPSGGGMEYSGATIASIPAIDHELLHSWFARGVMPAEGRSGWIDEAIASWRDYGYFQAASLLERPPTNLSNFSPYRKSTPGNAYTDGRQFLAELDRLFAPYGGLKPILRLFSDRYQHKVMTNEEFRLFLESMTLLDLGPYFRRYTLSDGN
jgi:hypothetical protein